MAVAAGISLSAAIPASATSYCPGGSGSCFFYNSNRGGAVHAYSASTPNFDGDVFADGGAGDGVPVKNNAASAANDTYSFTMRVYYNSNYAGVYDDVAPSSWRNLVKTKNNNASLRLFQ
ncbi:peptidase inhibitor family I36 protein [Streptomyces sp. NPDC006739]|uniref:peptidase inhibitor family I36 protein n=1 Tax=Streptomyces sp. NPDC006739 TaxID=3364763 RepID=UPI0036CECD8E